MSSQLFCCLRRRAATALLQNYEIGIRLFSLRIHSSAREDHGGHNVQLEFKREGEGNGVNTLFYPTLVYGYFNAN
jgi:hypothetical protein